HAGGDADLARLQALAEGDPAGIVAALLADGPVAPGAAAARGLLEAGAEASGAAAVVGRGEAVELAGGVLVSAQGYERLAAEVGERLAARAASHPLDPVLALGAAVGDVPQPYAIAARLEQDGVLERDAAGVRAPGTGAASSVAAEAADAL